MPTYEYECRKCGHHFEEFQMMTDPPIKVCPKCKSRRVKRLIGAGAGILFKGKGFYTTDYRSDAYRESAKQETSKSSEKDSKSPSKESKPAASDAAGGGSKSEKKKSEKKPSKKTEKS